MWFVLAAWLVYILGSSNRLGAAAARAHGAAPRRVPRGRGRLHGAPARQARRGAAADRGVARRRAARARSCRTARRSGRSSQRTPTLARGVYEELHGYSSAARGRRVRRSRSVTQRVEAGKRGDWMTQQARELESFLQREIGGVVYGLDEVIHALTIALIGAGHVLLEGPPGLGKTLLSNTFARALGGEFKRIQGTADLMPTDLTGVHVFDSQRGEFVFRRGPAVRGRRARRRGEPRGAEDAVRAARGDGGALRHRRRRALSAAGRFPDRRDAESARLRGHVSVAGVAARPFHDLRADELSEPRARAQDPRGVRVARQHAARFRGRADARDRACSPRRAPSSRACTCPTRSRATCSTSSPRAGRRRTSGSACRAARRSRSRAARGSRRRCAAAEFVVPDDVKRVAPWVIPHRLVLAPDAVLEGASARTEVERILAAVPVPRDAP